MMRSMYSAVAGLRTHQTRMDVIGDNIANVNTPGFKRARATFQDMFYQTLQGGTAGNNADSMGGTNPKQIGLGISLGSIDVIHTQGASSPTGKGTDLMIQGEGFFVLGGPNGSRYYSRAGAFAFDSEGYLVNPSNGLYVLDTNGEEIQLGEDEFNNVKSYSINGDGTISYILNDGETDQLVTTENPIAIAKFPNPGGLEKAGQNLYIYKDAAGPEAEGNDTDEAPDGGAPGQNGRGSIIAGALEMSNVELAQEFTEMIVTQRGFQANGKTITTSDEMLQELVNLKR